MDNGTLSTIENIVSRLEGDISGGGDLSVDKMCALLRVHPDRKEAALELFYDEMEAVKGHINKLREEVRDNPNNPKLRQLLARHERSYRQLCENNDKVKTFCKKL